MTSKRVFANPMDINFNDYMRKKSGIEIIKNIKSKPGIPNKLPFFINYNQFLLITQTYYKYIKTYCPEIQVPTSLYDANTSFIFYQTMVSHMKHCKECKDICTIYECKELTNILYPYGLVEKPEKNKIFLHSRFDLEEGCKKCLDKPDNPLNKCDCSNNVKNDKRYIYPSQNGFVFLPDNEMQDKHTQLRRMNSYSIYPNIKHCKTAGSLEHPSKPKSCPSGLCKVKSSLFI